MNDLAQRVAHRHTHKTAERTVHLTTRDDPLLTQIAHHAFPDFRGQRLTLIEQDGPVNITSYWSGGSKEYYVFVRLSDMRTMQVPESGGHPAQPEAIGSQSIPDGFVLVESPIFQGKQMALRIYVPSKNFNQFMLAPPVELTWAEKVVLVATRSLKPSYMGDSNVRFHESQKDTGITEQEWNEAKLNLIKKGLLNRAGALTPPGRNALEAAGLGHKDLYALRNRTGGVVMPSLREAVTKLASEKPELRKHLLPVLRKTAMEFDTQDALDKYLKEHPDADRANHSVKKDAPGHKEPEGLDHANWHKNPDYKTKRHSEYSPQKPPPGLKKPPEWRAMPKKLLDFVDRMSDKDMDKDEAYNDKIVKGVSAELQRYHTLEEVKEMHGQLSDLKKKFSDKFMGAKTDEKADIYRFPARKIQQTWRATNDALQAMGRAKKEKKGTAMSLRKDLLKLASEKPELRKHLLPLLRTAMDFPTEEALKTYLKEHPDADRANHRVVETEKPKGEKKEAPAKVKLPKDIGNLMQDYAGGSDIFRQVGSFATGGHEVDADKIQEAIAMAKKYINVTKNPDAAKSYGWGKTERGELEKILKALQQVAPKD